MAFVKLLLEAAQQDQFPIYVALTMRSDFIGDCIIPQACPKRSIQVCILSPG